MMILKKIFSFNFMIFIYVYKKKKLIQKRPLHINLQVAVFERCEYVFEYPVTSVSFHVWRTLSQACILCERMCFIIWYYIVILVAVHSLGPVWLYATPWTAACQTSLPITNSWSLLKLMSIESVMPPNHLTLCHPRLLPPSIFPSIRVFSNESVLCIRWPKNWSLSFSFSLSSKYAGLISFRQYCIE